jgi:hypothetical protein
MAVQVILHQKLGDETAALHILALYVSSRPWFIESVSLFLFEEIFFRTCWVDEKLVKQLDLVF